MKSKRTQEEKEKGSENIVSGRKQEEKRTSRKQKQRIHEKGEQVKKRKEANGEEIGKRTGKQRTRRTKEGEEQRMKDYGKAKKAGECGE